MKHGSFKTNPVAYVDCYVRNNLQIFRIYICWIQNIIMVMWIMFTKVIVADIKHTVTLLDTNNKIWKFYQICFFKYQNNTYL